MNTIVVSFYHCLPVYNKIRYADKVFKKLIHNSSNYTNANTLYLGDSIMAGIKLKLNLAIGGDTTYDLQNRWNIIHSKFPLVKSVWIHIGLNDLRNGVSTDCVADNIRNINTVFRAQNINAVFMKVIDADVPEKTNRVNNILEKYTDIKLAKWILPKKMYFADGIHPSLSGWEYMTEQIIRMQMQNNHNDHNNHNNHSILLHHKHLTF